MDFFAVFIQMLEARGLTDNTIRSYKTYIKVYLDYLDSLSIQPEQASWQVIRDFLSWLQKERSLSNRTMNAIISQLQFFQTYVIQKEWDKFQVPFRKFDRHLPYVPSREEICRFLVGVDDPDVNLAVSILYATGIRIGELCHLKYTDIHISSHRIYISRSKNRQNRFVPLIPLIWNRLLERWLSFPKGNRPHGWIFTQRHSTGRPMDKQWLQDKILFYRASLHMASGFSAHAILVCKTKKLGYNLSVCTNCSHKRIHSRYNLSIALHPALSHRGHCNKKQFFL